MRAILCIGYVNNMKRDIYSLRQYENMLFQTNYPFFLFIHVCHGSN